MFSKQNRCIFVLGLTFAGMMYIEWMHTNKWNPAAILSLPLVFMNTVTRLAPYVCYYIWTWPAVDIVHISSFDNALLRPHQPVKRVAIMMFHGLTTHPSDWFQVHKDLASVKGKYVFHAYTPSLYAMGNAPLNEVMEHVKEDIARFLQASSDMPVCVLGSSNGARVALMTRLMHNDRPMFVGLAAGPLHGSLSVDFVRGVAPHALSFFHPVLLDELGYKSMFARTLMDQIEAADRNMNTQYSCYASSLDHVVIPYTSSFLNNVHNVTNKLYDDIGHMAFPFHTAEDLVNDCVNWADNLLIEDLKKNKQI